jgi:hypothetical protein
MAKKTKRRHHQVPKGLSWASWASCDTTDTEFSDKSGLLDMIALGVCGWLISLESDAGDILSRRGENNSIDTKWDVGCMPSSPFFREIVDFVCFGRPPMDNYVSINDRCISVDGSELTMPRTIVRIAHKRELVQSTVTFVTMNLPTTGWLPSRRAPVVAIVVPVLGGARTLERALAAGLARTQVGANGLIVVCKFGTYTRYKGERTHWYCLYCTQPMGLFSPHGLLATNRCVMIIERWTKTDDVSLWITDSSNRR